MRNVEIKAKVRDVNALLERVKSLTKEEEEEKEEKVLHQIDTFYNHDKGKFKLRRHEDGTAELIFYQRPETGGPKLSTYERCALLSDDVDRIANMLKIVLGEKGTTVKKRRHLFLVGQTRIHIDEVETLGNYMELEVVLRDEQEVEDGRAIAEDLMKTLNIEADDLIDRAYVDLFLSDDD